MTIIFWGGNGVVGWCKVMIVVSYAKNKRIALCVLPT